MKRAAIALGVVVAVAAGCKKKASPGAGSGTAAVPVVVAPVDAAAPSIDAAATPIEEEPSASAGIVDAALAGLPYGDGPALSSDGARVVWCTAGDNGMAPFSEVVCHVAAVGKPAAEQLPVMTTQDAAAIDEASYDDDSADPAAKARAEAAKKRVGDAAAKVKARAGAELTAFGAAARRCATFDGNTDENPADDVVIGDDGACTIGGAKLTLTEAGVVTVAAAGKPLFSETFKRRGGDRPPPSLEDLDCKLAASRVEAVLEPTAKVLALQVWMSNPSDACAMVTEYEIRAVKLP